MVKEKFRVEYIVIVHDGLELVYAGAHQTFEEAHKKALEAWERSIHGDGAYLKIQKLVREEREGRG